MVAQPAQAPSAQIEANNLMFLQNALEQVAYCPVTGGSGTTAAWSSGTTLYFDFPEIGGAYIHGLEICYNLTVTPATAGGASYALNAVGEYGMFSEVKIDYGNTQVRSHPYFFSKILPTLQGFQKGPKRRVLAGNNDQLIANQLVGSTPLVVNTGNSWIGRFYLDLTPLGIDTVPGILPAMSVGNTPQLKLTCNSAFMGLDAFNSVVAGTGGSSPSVAVTGNINVNAYYRDGKSMRTNVPLALSLAGEPTMQYYWESALTPFNSGNTWQRKQISTRLEHWYMVSIIIDGQQSNSFLSNYANLTAFELGPDQSGQNIFKGWNSGNNISIYDYFDREVRLVHGQDLDLGVIAWVDAPCRGITNPDNRHGGQVLNMLPGGGFVATNHAYQVGAVSSTNFTPRVETFLVSMNYDGLKLVS